MNAKDPRLIECAYAAELVLSGLGGIDGADHALRAMPGLLAVEPDGIFL